MILDENRFATLADAMLEHIADTIDEALGDKIDVDLQHGILNMKLPGGGHYVINKHAPMRQIWMSSPASGATHFDHADGAWISSRAPHGKLDQMLVAELQAQFGVTLDL